MSSKVFNLFAIDGYPHTEISKMLDISEGTSRWHLASARKKLQEMIRNAMNASKIV
jgi:RNA polymerase sigma-70 factor (ECF subfamily)